VNKTVAAVATSLAALALIPVLHSALASGDESFVEPLSTPAPNIVLFLLDDARLDDVQLMSDLTRRIGAKGATFRNFYASFPLCCPARATLLTGQYPHNHGVLSNVQPTGGWKEFDDTSTLATWLNPTYRTGLVGKYFNEYVPPYLPPGWNEWMVPQWMYNYTGAKWWIDEGLGGTYRNLPGYQTDTIGALASDFVTRNAPAEEPFFLYTSIVAPHAGNPADPDDRDDVPTPYVKPRYRDAFSGKGNRNPSFNEGDVRDKPLRPTRLSSEEVAGVDEEMAQRREALLSAQDAIDEVLDALAATGELDNTFVMLMSDNGYILGEHRVRGGKLAPYEVSNHVPFVVRGPGIPAGRSLTAATAQVDFAPTVLRMAGLKIPESVDGVNLLPALRTGVPPSRPGILLEAADIDATTSPPPWVYQGVVSDRWKYVERTSGSRELYDLRADPAELVNVADRPEYAGTQRRLARLLAGYRNCAGATCR
jgi:N-acetylglucosamine-6-sulfatase